MNFIRDPLFIKPSKTLFALRAFVAFIDPARIVIGPKDNRRRPHRGPHVWRGPLAAPQYGCGAERRFQSKGGVIMAASASFIFSL